MITFAYNSTFIFFYRIPVTLMTNTIAMVAGLATPFVTGYQSFMVCRNSCHHIASFLICVFFVGQKKAPDVKVRIHNTHSQEGKLQLLNV